jgi:hypothetical protein
MAIPSKPGEKIRKSGIYSVVHEGPHAKTHEVTCVAGKRFPPCSECGDAVQFVLVRHARHVARQEHFKA